MVKIKFKKVRDNAIIPQRATDGSGAWDVFASHIEFNKEHPDLHIVYLGFALEFPKNYRLILVPRSSITKTRFVLQNSPGTGDSDYRGEYQYRFREIANVDTFTRSMFPFKVGDRIGQIYLEEIIPIEFEEVTELTDTVRGEGGFGSTGK